MGVASFISFLPLIFKFPINSRDIVDTNDTPLQISASDEGFRTSCIVGISAAAPLLFDLVTYSYLYSRSAPVKLRMIWWLLLSAIIPQVVVYVWYPNMDHQFGNYGTTDLERNTATRFYSENVLEIQESCSQAVEILNDLVTYEQCERGEIKLQEIIVVVQPFLQQILDNFSNQAKDNNIKFTVEYSKPNNNFDGGGVGGSGQSIKNAVMKIDSNRFTQALQTVLINAMKSSGKNGSVHIQIRTKTKQITAETMNSNSITNSIANSNSISITEKRGSFISRQSLSRRFSIVSTASIGIMPLQELEIEITDSGPSVSKSTRANIFVQDKINFKAGVLDERKTGSLALMIAYRLLRLHNGDISIVENGNNGNKYIIRMPLKYIEPMDIDDNSYSYHIQNSVRTSIRQFNPIVASPPKQLQQQLQFQQQFQHQHQQVVLKNEDEKDDLKCIRGVDILTGCDVTASSNTQSFKY
eukprot:gene12177-25558_t